MLGRRLLLVGLTLVYLSFSKVSSLEPDPLGKGLTCSSLNLDPVCCHGDSFGNQYNLCDPAWKYWQVDTLLTIHEHARKAYEADSPKRLTTDGFRIDTLPQHLWTRLLSEYKNATFDEIVSTYRADNEKCLVVKYPNVRCSTRVDLVSQETNRALFNELQPIIEKWVNHPLEPNSAYGFKRYMRGSHLSEHIDIPGERQVGVIIHMAHDADEPWPMQILDHNDQPHDVFIEPQQMVMFESEKLPHGRPKPLNGNFWDNHFLHYKLAV